MTIDVAAGSDFASAVTLLGTDVVVTGATDLDFNNGDVFVISLSSTGVPDARFGGGDGIVTRDVAGRWDVGNDVIANGNKILVAAARSRREASSTAFSFS